jgi:hypothetical protein
VNIHHHHIVPKIKGGTKTVPLCEECHGKVHGIDFTNHSTLTKEGLKRAKDKGIKLGSPQNLTREAKQKGNDAIKNNRLKDSNWIICKNFIEEFIKVNGKVNYTHISNSLNQQGYKTRKGYPYRPQTIRRIHLNF